MDEFNLLSHQNQSPKHSSFLQMNPTNMELFTNLALMENFNTTVDNGLMGFSDQPMSFNEEIPRSIGPNDPIFDNRAAHMVFPSGLDQWNNMNMVQEHEIQLNTSSCASGAAFGGPAKANKKNQNYGPKKRKRTSEREMEKPRDVVHVRAKRGQATDSHSLAERLRREKINDKLRCLQDLVPGCYKTMGMAVMLDVIINYVRSLQNQIDFLSMKLSAASLYYDFNSSEAEAIDQSVQGTNNVYEAAQEYGGISTQFQTANYWPL
ncbi:hypothetical protein CASFOL_004104 [Castilleja foliolosa]|uniref:BHLH domain-containing protein n=1 Tax=Castilleja foliolosa TaxID=1961234 RepID=A0ABD3EJF2_9LAMI